MGEDPWYADIVNYIASRYLPKGLSHQQKKKLFSELKCYFWDEPYLFRSYADGIIRHRIFRSEAKDIL